MSKNTLNISISRKASKIEPSITMAITAMANQMKKEGKHVIGFSAGEPDYDTPDHIKARAIQAITDGHTRYTAASGMPELRQAIADKIKSDYQLDYTADQIVVSCGAKHSIHNLLVALLNPGDEVIIPTPYWVSYPHQVRLADGEPIFVPTDEATGFKLTAEQLDEAITEQTKMVILTTPSNPTGAVYTQNELEKLRQVIIDRDILVLSDEIYEKLTYGVEHRSIAQLGPEIQARTILVNGLSKAYAMTGWRIGYFAADLAIAKAVNKIQSHTTSNPNTPAQWASLEALTAGDDEVDAMCQEFDKRRRVMVDRLNKMTGIECLEPLGAFYAFPNMSGCIGKKVGSITITDSMTFCEALLKEVQVACVPGAGFGAPYNLRLSYATSMANIQEGLDRIEAFTAQLK